MKEKNTKNAEQKNQSSLEKTTERGNECNKQNTS
jgi:hypothetical protein